MHIDAADAPDDQPNVQCTGKGAKIALDAFFDSYGEIAHT